MYISIITKAHSSALTEWHSLSRTLSTEIGTPATFCNTQYSTPLHFRMPIPFTKLTEYRTWIFFAFSPFLCGSVEFCVTNDTTYILVGRHFSGIFYIKIYTNICFDFLNIPHLESEVCVWLYNFVSSSFTSTHEYYSSILSVDTHWE